MKLSYLNEKKRYLIEIFEYDIIIYILYKNIKILKKI